MPRHTRAGAIAAAALVVAATLSGAGFSAAAELRPSWECLPEDTAIMVRLPRPAGFLQTLRTRTKFGAVALGAERMRQAWMLALDAWGGGDEPNAAAVLEERIARYGLTADDVTTAFAGDTGIAVVVRPRGDGLPPLSMALAWMEPGEESARKFVGAFERLLEEADEDERGQRTDVDMAGHRVIWITRPILQPDLGDVKIEGRLDAARLQELREELAARARQAPQVLVGKLHFFLAQVGGRLLAGQTLPPGAASIRGGGATGPGGPRPQPADDPDRASGTDEARGIFERYLAAHAGDDGSPLADALQTQAMRATLPPGEPLVDVVLDPRPWLQAATAGDDEARRRLAAVGLGELGPIAMRQSFDEGRLRQGVFVTLPAPRAGLFRILEQECAAAEVPSFVTSGAVDFTQISLELAQAYRVVKDLAIAEGGEQAANLFMTAEMQAQGWLGLELEAMLANLGSRHWIITYPPQIAAAIQEVRRKREAGVVAAISADRTAFVWKLADDAPVIALLPKISALAGTQVVEEQGFQGVRAEGGLSVFAGRGHLVVSLGGDALEQTLAGIRNPPAGAASLREGDVPRKAAELVSLGPSRMFAVGDATRTGGMLGDLREFVTAMVPDDVEEDFREVLAKAQALMPTAEDMHGVFGVGATVMEVNDAGISIRSAWEMPPQ